jgi:hypothetical protein
VNAAQRKLLSMAVDLVSYEADHLSDGMLLTDECRRITARHPIAGRVVILGAGVIITLHLADVISERYDVMARKFWTRGLVDALSR